MDEYNNEEVYKEAQLCPTCYGEMSGEVCVSCEIENEKQIESEKKKENKNEDEDEYDWREHKR